MAVSIQEYKKALLSLEEAISFVKKAKDSANYKIARDAAIQRFEFCIELSWKVSAKILGSSSTTAKPVIREMAQNQLISDPNLWFDFIEARNKSSHSYDEDIAKQVYEAAEQFLTEGNLLLKQLEIK